MTTRRPRIGLLAMGKRTLAAIEQVDENGRVVGYVDQISAKDRWFPSDIDGFVPLAEVPEPRMDEPQETWATVIAKEAPEMPQRVHFRTPNGRWKQLTESGAVYAGGFYDWDDLIDPRPTTPTERATGTVGGEDQ